MLIKSVLMGIGVEMLSLSMVLPDWWIVIDRMTSWNSILHCLPCFLESISVGRHVSTPEKFHTDGNSHFVEFSKIWNSICIQFHNGVLHFEKDLWTLLYRGVQYMWSHNSLIQENSNLFRMCALLTLISVGRRNSDFKNALENTTHN